MKAPLTLCLLLFTLASFSQKFEYKGVVFTFTPSADQTVSECSTTDTASKVTITTIPSDSFWGIGISNKSKDPIKIVWDESTFMVNGISNRIIFNTTRIYAINNPTIPDVVIPGGYVFKSIIPYSCISSPTQKPVYKKRDLKNNPAYFVITIMIDADGRKFPFTIKTTASL